MECDYTRHDRKYDFGAQRIVYAVISCAELAGYKASASKPTPTPGIPRPPPPPRTLNVKPLTDMGGSRTPKPLSPRVDFRSTSALSRHCRWPPQSWKSLAAPSSFGPFRKDALAKKSTPPDRRRVALAFTIDQASTNRRGGEGQRSCAKQRRRARRKP